MRYRLAVASLLLATSGMCVCQVAIAGGIETATAEAQTAADACDAAISAAELNASQAAVLEGHTAQITGSKCECGSSVRPVRGVVYSCLATVTWQEEKGS